MTRTVAARWRARGESGIALIAVTLIAMVLLGLVAVSTNNAVHDLNVATRQTRQSTAFQAAEAGINDYISKLTEDHSYHLHFVHPAESSRLDPGGNLRAAGAAWTGATTWTYPTHTSTWRTLSNGFMYNLEVVAPTAGSPNLTIFATAKSPNGTEKRKLEVTVRTGSIADYQMVANRDISYGATATTKGKIYAGIDENGVAHNVAHAGNAYENVYAEGQVTGMAPARLFNNASTYDRDSTPPIRDKVQSPINFNAFTETFLDVKSAATVGGLLLDNNAYHGWRLTFNAVGTITVDTCMRSGGYDLAESAPVCTFNKTVAMPANGAIYVGQTAIVQGVVDGQVTVVTNGDIVIGNNISYELAGNDVLGLIARNNVFMAQWSPNSLSINAAVIAQTGMYRSWTSANVKTGTFTHLGAVATNLGGYMSMFTTRNYVYDTDLLYLQPPFFPVLEESYSVLDFRELTP